jgi:exodeoxyribonuclease VII small subunit
MEKTFEQLLQELEVVTTKLKKEDLPLEEALALYKSGVELSKVLTKKLNNAKEVIIKDISE